MRESRTGKFMREQLWGKDNDIEWNKLRYEYKRKSALLNECLELLKTLESCGAWYMSALEIDLYNSDMDGEELHEAIKSIINKAKGER